MSGLSRSAIAAALTLGLVLIAPHPRAQMLQAIVGDTHQSAGCTGYTGPGDVVPGANRYYGLSAYNCAYAASGGASFTYICPVGGGTTGTVHFASNGGLNATDVASMVAACGANSQYYATFPDQTGNGHTATGDSTNPPNFLTSCDGSLACIWFYGQFDNSFSTAAALGINQPITYVTVNEEYGGGTQEGIAADTNVEVGYRTTSPFLYAGTIATASSISTAFHALQFIMNGALSILVVDSSTSTLSPTSPGTSNPSGTFYIGTDTAGGSCRCYMGLLGVWPVAFNSTQYGAMHTLLSSLWSTP